MNMHNTLPKSWLLLLLLTSISFFSQEETQKIIPKNELKIDVADLAFNSTLDIAYERISNHEMTYGASFLINLNNSDDLSYEKLAITPFFRFYFFNKEDFGAKGFFLEVFSKFSSGNYSYYWSGMEEQQDYFDVGLGFSVGKKWISSKGFSVEMSLGGGRNLRSNEVSPDFVTRGGVSVGYLF